MKHPVCTRRAMILALALSVSLALPASAFLFSQDDAQPAAVSAFSKNTTLSGAITFSADDFIVTGDGELDCLIVKQLPDTNAGMLTLGGQPIAEGDVVALPAVEALRFTPLAAPTVAATSLTFTPVFSDGSSGEDVSVGLYLLTAANTAPVAEDITFTTYKNVAYTGQLSAVDPEGDLLTFQLVDKPARGAVTMPEDGSNQFVYTPYENKTGKDSFTYVAIDAVGNTSQPATVTLRIEKPDTKVTYADMAGHPAYNAALTLAAEGIYVGAKLDESYFFHPDTPVSRSEFLAMAMTTVGLDALEGVTATGFWDDETIAVWAKPYVSSALKSGAVQGTVAEDGQVVFQGQNDITRAEAAVLLDRLLAVTDVSAESWTGNTSTVPTWACQAAMNLETVGVLHTDATGTLTLDGALTRADAAQMLCSALDVMEARDQSSGWLPW